MELQNTLVVGSIGAVVMVVLAIIVVFALSMWDYRKGKRQEGVKEKAPVVEVQAKSEGGIVQSLLILGILGALSWMVFGIIATADNNQRAIAYLEKTQGGTFDLIDVDGEKDPKLLGYGGHNKFNVTQELNGKTSSYTVIFENGKEPVIQEYKG